MSALLDGVDAFNTLITGKYTHTNVTGLSADPVVTTRSYRNRQLKLDGTSALTDTNGLLIVESIKTVQLNGNQDFETVRHTLEVTAELPTNIAKYSYLFVKELKRSMNDSNNDTQVSYYFDMEIVDRRNEVIGLTSLVITIDEVYRSVVSS